MVANNTADGQQKEPQKQTRSCSPRYTLKLDGLTRVQVRQHIGKYLPRRHLKASHLLSTLNSTIAKCTRCHYQYSPAPSNADQT